MGPPSVPPAMCCSNEPFGRPARLFSHVFALNASSRKNSKRLPLSALDPCLIEALITAPAALPNSAEYVRVWTRNSSSASTGGCTTSVLCSCRFVDGWLVSPLVSVELFYDAWLPCML